MPCKKSLDYSEKSQDQPKHHSEKSLGVALVVYAFNGHMRQNS